MTVMVTSPGGGYGCVTVRSYRRARALGLGAGPDVRISRDADHVERTSAAFLWSKSAREAQPVQSYAAVRGCTGQEVARANRLAVERHGRTWQQPKDKGEAQEELVLPARLGEGPERLIREVVAQLPRLRGVSASVEAHRAVDRRLYLRPDQPAVGETLSTASVVIDLFRQGRLIADVDEAWGGAQDPDPGRLVGRLERTLARAEARHGVLPERVQLLLLDGTAGVFLHEVCGHLLESTWSRPSLVASRRAHPIANDSVSVADNPRRAGAFGAYQYTMLGVESRRRTLLDRGRLMDLLEDTPDGPWRAEHAGRVPQPRMSHLELAPAPSGILLDQALGRAAAPVLRVHRFGPGSLNHRDGTVVIEVKEATTGSGPRLRRLAPFRVTAEARQLLLEIQAVGDAGTAADWSAYCLSSSGRVPVGASAPTMLTGVMSTLPCQPTGTAGSAAA